MQNESADPIWLKDGSFLWLSERSGFRHLYHYKADGSLINQVTSGDWEVRRVKGVDAPKGWVYFSGTARSVIGRDVYRIKLDGSGLQRLSEVAGTHDARFSPGWSFYLDSWTDATTPHQVKVHRSEGGDVRMVEANPVPALNEFRLSKPEFLQVKTRDGFVMEAMMIKPPIRSARRVPSIST